MYPLAPSRPSERAFRLSSGLVGLCVCLFVSTLLLIFSFSIWSILLNVLFLVYAFFVLRIFKGDDPIVGSESMICFAFSAGLNCLLSVFTLVSLVTKKQMLFDRLKPWQGYVGMVGSGLAVAAYLGMTIVSILLFRDLRETQVQFDEEATPFMQGRGSGGGSFASSSISSNSRFGSFRHDTPTGTYASQHAPPQQTPQSKPRFPGKGYKLKD
uniref:MARVEL domain-containing protein n=1 Tax=Mucochytrium quahogii TaxID=96639 RepID=A0A7S2W8L2_9STRA|mmetsp:Transcript_13898/g.22688  ORF Transcript_13898/g.22688 Transcript_13898/m.22688 type:complete len:212 (+) Transcript_13898:44-679(+)